MTYQCEGVSIFRIGPIEGNVCAVQLNVGFSEDMHDHRPLVRIDLAIPVDGSTTIDDIEQSAFQKASKVLVAAMTAFMRHDRATLVQMAVM